MVNYLIAFYIFGKNEIESNSSRIYVFNSSNLKSNSELKGSESLNRGHFFARSGDRQQASCRSSSQSHNLFKLQWVEINFEVHFVSNKPRFHLLIFWRELDW